MEKAVKFLVLFLLLSCRDDIILLPNSIYVGGSTTTDEFFGASATVSLNLLRKSTEDITISIQTAGSATMGVDYSTIPAEIVIPAGFNTFNIPISIIEDNIYEGTEHILLSLQVNNATNRDFDELEFEFSIEIKDNDHLIELTWTNEAGDPGLTDLDLYLRRGYNLISFYDVASSATDQQPERITFGGNFPDETYGLIVEYYDSYGLSGAINYTVRLRTSEGDVITRTGRFEASDHVEANFQLVGVIIKEYGEITIYP